MTRSCNGALGCLAISFAAFAAAQTPLVKAFHPAGPLPSYDVATIKPADPDLPFAGTTLRRYIAQAYGVPIPWGVPGSEFSGSQVVGGPAWIDRDKFEIKGKPADELREAMQKMPRNQRQAQDEMMEQSLLAERFHLKVHFETREMSVFELVPAKGGIKITAVDPPSASAFPKPTKSDPLPAGMTSLSVSMNGASIINARATTMELFTNGLRGQSPEIAGRPIVDKTGFTGNFDIKDFRFLGVVPPQHGDGSVNVSEPDVPSLSRALEEKLGLKLVPAKAQVEVVVIDSIDHPSDN